MREVNLDATGVCKYRRIMMVNPGLVLYTDTSTEYSTIFIQESDSSHLSYWFLCLCNSYTVLYSTSRVP
ncbi:hypothetical protein HOLleu_42910 [Holothuria leucospilota]|uniref:Uncharacterized protein n=1 Tax=Holothuria leucospilota TaxID=206669 RepID=A0A9Q0YCA1_HOLLE|nr:hypothetical protein HOLleu_42910 [Holothuria leucospilota]